MKKLLFLIPVLFMLCVSAQNDPLLKPARIIFYNTENLFDTINDPSTDDEDFLPGSKNAWNTEKYQLKLQHTAQVIARLLDTIQPMVIGLAEVENRKVLEDLIAQKELKKYNLGIIHRDSPDERGIDVAMLYNKDVIEIDFDAHLKVDLDSDKTRDIVYLRGAVNESAAIWIFVNHWPSRNGSKQASEPKRIEAQKVLKAKIENIYKGEPNARIIAMGDFNDNSTDSSLVALISARHVSTEQNLVNLMKPLYQKGKYSLTYKEEHDLFDQFIVSQSLLNTKSSYYIRTSGAGVYSPDWLMFKHPKYGLIPNRTYAGGKWVGGYSDHLPVYIDIIFK